MSSNGTVDEALKWIDSLPNWGKAAVAGGAALVLYIPYKIWATQPRKSPFKSDWKQDTVYLYQFPRARNVPNLSIFCLKVETWLRMSDIYYEIPKIKWNIRSKEGTLPFVEHNGLEYYDSHFLIRDLDVVIQHTSIDDHLSPEQKATTRAFEALIEKSLGVSALVPRMENIDKVVDLLDPKEFGIFAALFKLINAKAYAGVLSRKIGGTDLGSHNRDDRIQIGSDDLRGISHYLGNKHFLHGFKPTKIDACLFSSLAQILYAPYDSEHREVMNTECKNLVEYVERIKNRFWPDWENSTIKYSTDTNWKKRPQSKNGKYSP